MFNLFQEGKREKLRPRLICFHLLYSRHDFQLSFCKLQDLCLFPDIRVYLCIEAPVPVNVKGLRVNISFQEMPCGKLFYIPVKG